MLRGRYEQIADNPDLAWRFIERRDSGDVTRRRDDLDDDSDGGSVITLRVDG